jgi:hypothetical protein
MSAKKANKKQMARGKVMIRPLIGDDNATNLLTATPDEVALAIASALPCAADRVRLAAACRRYALKRIPHGGGELLSLADESGRRWIEQRGERERGWVPRRGRESHLSLMREVELLLLPLTFSVRALCVEVGLDVGDYGNSDWAVATRLAATAEDWPGNAAAATTAVMRAGRHFAEFRIGESTLDNPDDDRPFPSFGVVLAQFDVEKNVGYTGPKYTNGNCFYDPYGGQRYPGAIMLPRAGSTCRSGNHDGEWEGIDQRPAHGDCVGMLLDLDQGTMTVFIDDLCVGVMENEGLKGCQFRWAVSVETGQGGCHGCCGEIKSMKGNPLPAGYLL